MNRRVLYGPMILFLWQTAPVAVHPDELGRLRLSLGYGAEGWNSKAEQVNCAGDVVGRSERSGQASGPALELEVWPTRQIRVTALTTSVRGSSRESSAPMPTALARHNTGVLIARENTRTGFGIGLARLDGDGTRWVPQLHLRIGSLDSLHGRFDLVPAELPGGQFWLRAGVGSNQGRRSGTRWVAQLGQVFGRSPQESQARWGVALFGEVMAPIVRSNLELRFSGRLGFGQLYHPSIGTDGGYTSWGAKIGLRYSLGR